MRSRRSRLKRVENPVEFGIVITREDGTIERFLEKPTWGEVFSDTINTNIYVLEPEIFDFIPAGEVVDFSSDVFPAVLEQGQEARRSRDRRLLGGRRHARGLPPRARGHPRRPHAPRDARLRGPRRRVAGGGRRPLARRRGLRAGAHRRQLAGRGRRGAAALHRARRRRRGEGRRRARTLRRARPRLHRPRRAPARRGGRARERHPRRRARSRRTSSSATSASSARTRSSTRR